jgi:hypothetical protein
MSPAGPTDPGNVRRRSPAAASGKERAAPGCQAAKAACRQNQVMARMSRRQSAASRAPIYCGHVYCSHEVAAGRSMRVVLAGKQAGPGSLGSVLISAVAALCYLFPRLRRVASGPAWCASARTARLLDLFWHLECQNVSFAQNRDVGPESLSIPSCVVLQGRAGSLYVHCCVARRVRQAPPLCSWEEAGRGGA